MSRWQEIRHGWRREEQAVLLLCFTALAFCAGVGYTRWRTATPLPPLFEDAPSTAGKGSTRTTRTATILVHVAGSVRKPGVLTLPADARINDAIRGAGGATPGGDAKVNYPGRKPPTPRNS